MLPRQWHPTWLCWLSLPPPNLLNITRVRTQPHSSPLLTPTCGPTWVHQFAHPVLQPRSLPGLPLHTPQISPIPSPQTCAAVLPLSNASYSDRNPGPCCLPSHRLHSVFTFPAGFPLKMHRAQLHLATSAATMAQATCTLTRMSAEVPAASTPFSAQGPSEPPGAQHQALWQQLPWWFTFGATLASAWTSALTAGPPGTPKCLHNWPSPLPGPAQPSVSQ